MKQWNMTQYFYSISGFSLWLKYYYFDSSKNRKIPAKKWDYSFSCRKQRNKKQQNKIKKRYKTEFKPFTYHILSYQTEPPNYSAVIGLSCKGLVFMDLWCLYLIYSFLHVYVFTFYVSFQKSESA